MRFHSFLAQMNGAESLLRFFELSGGPAGGSGGGSFTTAPVSAPATSAPAADPFTPAPTSAPPQEQPPHLRGGFRVPGGVNPLLGGPTPAPAPAPVVTPAVAPQPAPVAAPAPAPAPAPQVFDFGGRKVTAADLANPNNVAALQRDYVNLQGAMTRSQQQIAQMRQQTPQQPAAQTPAQAAPAATAQPVDLKAAIAQAVSGINAEQFSTQLYENPGNALGGILEQTLGPILSGLQSQFDAKLQQQTAQANQYVQERQTEAGYASELEQMAATADQFPGLSEALPAMEQILINHPYLFNSPNPMQAAYLMARGSMAPQQAPAAQPQPITMESVMADQNVMGQLMQNPQIRDQIVRSYLEALRAGQPPVNLGAGSGSGLPPATPANRPTNIREAGQMARQFLFNRGPQ